MRSVAFSAEGGSVRVCVCVVRSTSPYPPTRTHKMSRLVLVAILALCVCVWNVRAQIACSTDGDCPSTLFKCCEGFCACGNCTNSPYCTASGFECCPASSGPPKCVDLLSSRHYCGACNISCGIYENCCNGVCTSVIDNNAHCGSCSNVCPENHMCCGHSCHNVVSGTEYCGNCSTRISRGLGQICCNETVIYGISDPNHCGDCNTKCDPNSFDRHCIYWECRNRFEHHLSYAAVVSVGIVVLCSALVGLGIFAACFGITDNKKRY